MRRTHNGCKYLLNWGAEALIIYLIRQRERIKEDG